MIELHQPGATLADPFIGSRPHALVDVDRGAADRLAALRYPAGTDRCSAVTLIVVAGTYLAIRADA